MAGLWKSLSVKPPAELSAAGGAVSEGLHAVKAGIQGARVALEAARALASSLDQPNVMAFNAAVQGLIATANAALDAALDDAAVYALVVPLPKKGLLGLIPAPEGGPSTFVDAPVANILKGVSSAAELKNLPTWRQAFDPEAAFVGGNAWFLRCVADSLHDAGDENRPQFTRDSYWAYTIVVGGAQDITAAASVAAFFSRLLGLGADANTVPADRNAVSFVPRNVRARPSGRQNRVVITWDRMSPTTRVDGDTTLSATHYAVIRSRDFRVRTVQVVQDLFGNRELSQGIQGEYGSEVVALHRYDGITSRWVESANLDEGVDYFYNVAFRVRSDSGSGETDLGFTALSSCAAVRLDRRRTLRAASNGTPPDWMRTPSVARVFPAVSGLIDRVKEEVQVFGDMVKTVNDDTNAVITFLSREADRYTKKADELTRYLERINALLMNTQAGAHCYVGQGQGSVGTFLGDMTRAFDLDESPDRPDFTFGSEYVTGFVLVAVGPDPEPVLRALRAFETFFGDSEEDPVIAGITSVDGTRPADPVTSTASPDPLVAFDAAMQPTAGPDAGCRPE